MRYINVPCEVIFDNKTGFMLLLIPVISPLTNKSNEKLINKKKHTHHHHTRSNPFFTNLKSMSIIIKWLRLDKISFPPTPCFSSLTTPAIWKFLLRFCVLTIGLLCLLRSWWLFSYDIKCACVQRYLVVFRD